MLKKTYKARLKDIFKMMEINLAQPVLSRTEGAEVQQDLSFLKSMYGDTFAS